MNMNSIDILERGVENVFPSKEKFAEVMDSKKVSIYLGIDPTSPILHLGHLSILLILKRFKEAGHKVVIVIGGFTARIGDPSDKDAARKPMTEDQINENAKTYKEQIKRILGDVEYKNNADWLKKLTFEDILRLSAKVTVQQMLERDMFQKRLKAEKPIGVHEFMYPLMQGYDSVAMEIDAEIGGNDQLFNMMVGRDLSKMYLDKEKFVVATKLLIDPETGKKMSATEGRSVSLDKKPEELYGAVMALDDGYVFSCFELCTEVPTEEVEKQKDTHPREAKSKLAFEIVKLIYGEDKAEKAKEEFEKVFKEGGVPEEMQEFKLEGSKSIMDVLIESGLAESKSEARRLISGKGVTLDEKVVDDWDVEVSPGQVLKVGKHRFIKIT
jgi:tyrosyl-tRNA synthetase